MIRRNWRWLTLALEQPGETFEPGEVHTRRKCSSRRDQKDPEQPEADAHLIPGVAPRCERQRQGRPGCGSLLGFETRFPGPHCTISVPNLMADRPAELLVGWSDLNVRRLMYQPLIWLAMAGDDARGMGAALDAERLQGDPDPLIDGVRRDVELGRNLF